MNNTIPTDLSRRTKTAVVLVGALFALELLAAYSCVGRWLMLVAGMTVVAIAAFEASRLGASPDQSTIRGWFRIGCFATPGFFVCLWAMTAGFCAAASWGGAFALLAGVAIAILLGLADTFEAGKDDIDTALRGSGLHLLLMVLVGVGGGALVALTTIPSASGVTLWLFGVVCCNDIAAYLFGSRFGQVKLAPAISPKKTIVGSGAGLLAGGIVGVILSGLVDQYQYGLLTTAIFAVIVTVGAQLGDLTKSLVKRVAGVKDSGALFPGHGGVIDRLDGVFGAAPLVLALFH